MGPSIRAGIGGDLHFSLGPDKRTSIDGLAMYKVSAAETNMFRLHDEWISVVREP